MNKNSKKIKMNLKKLISNRGKKVMINFKT